MHVEGAAGPTNMMLHSDAPDEPQHGEPAADAPAEAQVVAVEQPLPTIAQVEAQMLLLVTLINAHKEMQRELKQKLSALEGDLSANPTVALSRGMVVGVTCLTMSIGGLLGAGLGVLVSRVLLTPARRLGS